MSRENQGVEVQERIARFGCGAVIGCVVALAMMTTFDFLNLRHMAAIAVIFGLGAVIGGKFWNCLLRLLEWY